MNRATAWGIHSTIAVVAGTGVVLTWTVFFASAPAPDDEFFAVQHPWQPVATVAHILVAPALVFLVGLIWRTHVWARVHNPGGMRWRTGLLSAVLFPALVASGYLLQVADGETLRTVLGWTHAGIGVAFAVTYVVHLLPRRGNATDPDA